MDLPASGRHRYTERTGTRKENGYEDHKQTGGAAAGADTGAEPGSWELYERPGGDGDPARVDGGTLREGGEAGVYYADSTDFDGVTYDMQAADEDVLYWGGEYDCYQRGQ